MNPLELKTRPCKHAELDASCPACNLFARDERYTHLRGPEQHEPAKAERFRQPIACVHRGEPTGETRPCKTCTVTVNVPLHACATHGVCSLDKAVTTADGTPVQSCRACNDHVAPLLIPRKLHRVWVGGNAMPERFEAYWSTWKKHHPDWEFYTWTDEDIARFDPEIQRVCSECRNPAEISDVLRYAIIAEHGGAYVDTDFECYRNIESLLVGGEFVAAWENPEMVASAFFAAVPGHAILTRLVEKLRGMRIDRTVTQMKTAGPRVFTEAIGDTKRPGVMIQPTRLFYPVPYDDRHKSPPIPPTAYAVHWWAHTWESDWTTLTVQVTGDRTPVETTHVCEIRPGDTFAPDGLARIKATLRRAPNYAENDFGFLDNEGRIFWVQAAKHRGNNPVFIGGEPVLLRG